MCLTPLRRRAPPTSGLQPPASSLRLLRRGVESLVVLTIAILLADSFLIDGWLVPTIVSSGSMAPALLGPHRTARCKACGMPLVCDAEDLTVDSLVCPNCGEPNNPLDPRTVAGDRLLIDRATFGVRPPRRWEVVVFRCTTHAGDYCVKRIVGLPGETVEVRDGDVFIDGQIARKTLAEQRAMAILVHDSVYRDPRLPPRWNLFWPNSDWHQSAEGGWTNAPVDEKRADNWLTYIHCRRVPGSPDAIERIPIRDDDPYNPDTSRRLYDVTDLMLVARLKLSGKGTLLLRANDGHESFRLEIQAKSRHVVLQRDRDREELQTGQLAAGLLDRSFELILSTFDQRVLLAIDGRTELTFDYLRPSGPLNPVARRLAIGTTDLEIAIERLQIYRDVYYTPPTHPVATLSRRLGPDEYFILGDNSAISVDSRSWMGGETVPKKLLVGRVLVR